MPRRRASTGLRPGPPGGSARRASLRERRELKERSKKPRTRPVPHPFLLPNISAGK